MLSIQLATSCPAEVALIVVSLPVPESVEKNIFLVPDCSTKVIRVLPVKAISRVSAVVDRVSVKLAPQSAVGGCWTIS